MPPEMTTPLADLAALERVTRPRGTVLFRQGDRGQAVYLVNEGAVGLYRESSGQRSPLATIRKGEMFGEMAAIDDSVRQATAVTLEDSELTVINVHETAEKLRSSDPFIRALVVMLMSNLRNVHEAYTPKSRSVLDCVNALQRLNDLVGRFMQAKAARGLKADLEGKLVELDAVLKDLRRIVMTYRNDDRRHDAIPSDTDFPG